MHLVMKQWAIRMKCGLVNQKMCRKTQGIRVWMNQVYRISIVVINVCIYHFEYQSQIQPKRNRKIIKIEENKKRIFLKFPTGITQKSKWNGHNSCRWTFLQSLLYSMGKWNWSFNTEAKEVYTNARNNVQTNKHKNIDFVVGLWSWHTLYTRLMMMMSMLLLLLSIHLLKWRTKMKIIFEQKFHQQIRFKSIPFKTPIGQWSSKCFQIFRIRNWIKSKTKCENYRFSTIGLYWKRLHHNFFNWFDDGKVPSFAFGCYLWHPYMDTPFAPPLQW